MHHLCKVSPPIIRSVCPFTNFVVSKIPAVNTISTNTLMFCSTMQLYAIISTFCTMEQLVVALLEEYWSVWQLLPHAFAESFIYHQQSHLKIRKQLHGAGTPHDGEIGRTSPVVLKCFVILGLMLCVLSEAKDKTLERHLLSINTTMICNSCGWPGIIISRFPADLPGSILPFVGDGNFVAL